MEGVTVNETQFQFQFRSVPFGKVVTFGLGRSVKYRGTPCVRLCCIYMEQDLGARLGFTHGAKNLPPPPTTFAPDDAFIHGFNFLSLLET
jgi:hypothetical protein